MIKIVGISFKEHGKMYYFDSNNIFVKKKDYVIVETERGLQFGIAVTNIFETVEKDVYMPMKKVIRIATDKDIEINKNNSKDYSTIIKKCNELILKHKLEMKLTDVSYTFDKKQLFFYFLADDRVDFRGLAKDLAQIYKTRIELRQIGVRDQAKEIGGIGPCGRMLCCTKFLSNFDTVTINMAKNQNLALTPNKINGVCGRLLCCLTYEDKNYFEYKKGLPEIGQFIKTEKGKGKVISIDVFKRSFRTYIEDFGVFEEFLKEEKK